MCVGRCSWEAGSNDWLSNDRLSCCRDLVITVNAMTPFVGDTKIRFVRFSCLGVRFRVLLCMEFRLGQSTCTRVSSGEALSSPRRMILSCGMGTLSMEGEDVVEFVSANLPFPHRADFGLQYPLQNDEMTLLLLPSSPRPCPTKAVVLSRA